MIDNKQLSLNANIFSDLLANWSNIESTVISAYGMLSEAPLGTASNGVLAANPETYSVLLSTEMIYLMSYMQAIGELAKYNSSYPKLDAMFNTRSSSYILNNLGQLNGVSRKKLNGAEDVYVALQTFGVARTDTTADGDTIEDEDKKLMDELDGFFGDIDPSEIGNITEDDVPEIEILEGELIDTETPAPETPAPETPAPETLAPETPVPETPAPETPDDYKADAGKEELIDKLKSAWGRKAESSIKDITAAYKDLYASGYGLIPSIGILTDKGIFCTTTDGKIKLAGDPATDIEIYSAITKYTGNQFRFYSRIGEEIDITKLIGMKDPITYIDYHLRFMFGHINFCKGEHSLRRYMTKHGLENEKTTKIVKYSDMAGYIREEVEKVFYNAYIACGVTEQVNEESIALVNNINTVLYRSLKNVIAVIERKDGVNTKLRICSSNPLNIDGLVKHLNQSLNIGTSTSTDVKLMGNGGNTGVYDINIIYNTKAFSQDSLFAYQVTEKLMEQGIRPSWNNVVLGKDTDGNIMTYNFEDPNNSSIALYGGKGSGKGVMTLNLISSALADGCPVVYMDAKPDTAIPLAEVAWRNGLDACIFNGKENAGAGLEQQAGCPRGNIVDRFYSKDYIPKGIFKTNESMERFILLTTYYRGLELFLDLAEARAAVTTNKGDNGKWLVGVFDEVQQLASTETTVMEQLDEIKKSREKAKVEVDGKMKPLMYQNDDIWRFINDYQNWRAIMFDRMATALGSTFRKANITVIWIWQTTDFPYSFRKTSIVARAINQEAPAMVKIVGRGGVASSGGSVVFGTDSNLRSNTTWYDERFTGKVGGNWAIGNRVNSDEAMTIFRPFNVYSDASNKKLLVQNAKAAGLSEEDLYGISLDANTHNPIPEIGFEGYVNKLLTPYGINAAQQLNLGYKLAEQSVIGLGKGNNLLEFMYNAHKFSVSDEDMQKLSEKNYGFDPDEPSFVGSNILPDTDSESSQRANTGFQPEESPKRPGTPGETGNIFNRQQNTPTGVPSDYDKQMEELKDADNDTGSNGVQPTNSTPDTPRNKAEQINQVDGDRYKQEVIRQLVAEATKKWEDIELEYGDDLSGVLTDGTASTELEDKLKEIEALNQKIERYSAPETVLNMNKSSAYRFGKDAEFGMTFITPTKTSKFLQLDETNSVILTVKDDGIRPKTTNRLLKSIRGTNYELSTRWKIILKKIAETQDPSTIRTVKLFNDAMIFGKRQIAAIGIIGGAEGVEVRDIVNFVELNKTFKNIRELWISMEVYEAATSELGNAPEMQLFNLMKNLEKLCIYEKDYSDNYSQAAEYTRQSIKEAKKQAEIEARAAKTQLKQGIDTIAASKNPHVRDFTALQVHRVHQASANLTGSSWNVCKKQFDQGHLIRTGLFGAITLVAGITSVGIGGISKVFKKIQRKV